MKISFSATNPCHLFPLAFAVAEQGSLGCYYSGYPPWKLPDAARLTVRSHSLATLTVYGLLKLVPERWRPSSRKLFLWQDRTFDRWVGAQLRGVNANADLPRLARLAEVWDKISRAARETESYNLERKPLVFSVFGLLAEATA